MCDSGSRTPLHYGSMTPIHDGSRTPNASSEWDPAVSNTYPSPGYTPSKFLPKCRHTFKICNEKLFILFLFFIILNSYCKISVWFFFVVKCITIINFFNITGTPGYQMNGPYTPQTPGTMYDTTYSPYQASPGYQSVVSTPSPATGYGQSPSSNNPYNTPSSGYSPNMPYNPQTPGASLDVLPMTDWHTVDIEVSLSLFLVKYVMMNVNKLNYYVCVHWKINYYQKCSRIVHINRVVQMCQQRKLKYFKCIQFFK